MSEVLARNTELVGLEQDFDKNSISSTRERSEMCLPGAVLLNDPALPRCTLDWRDGNPVSAIERGMAHTCAKSSSEDAFMRPFVNESFDESPDDAMFLPRCC
jgi:hypothetical protein